MTLVVAAALVAGMLSFLLATPDPGARVDADELGFSRLDTTHVFASLGHAAEFHRAAQAATLGARAVTTTSRGWLVGVPGSSGRRGAVPANVRVGVGDGVASRRVAAFVEWADELPANRWHVTTSTPIPVAGADRSWTVGAEIEVDVAQALTRTRRQVVPVQVQLRGSIAELRGAPRSWVVEDVVVGPSPGWLRAYRDPLVVGSGTIDVIAPASARAIAQDAAATASAVLGPLTTRYATRGGASTLAVWMVERPGRVQVVTGAAAPAEVRIAAKDSPHAMAWADDRGDLVVDLSRFQGASAAARGAALRHALAHFATRQVTKRAPAMLSEGIALAEERRAGRTIVITPGELATLDAAFTSRTSGIAELVGAPTSPKLHGELEELAAVATVAWLLDERGADRVQALLAAIDGGTAPDVALRRTVGLAPRGVERQVAAWVRAQVPATAAPAPSVGDEADVTDDGAEVPAT